MMRIDKLLCSLNLGSRSQVKELLRKGQVEADGEVVLRPEHKVDENTVLLRVQGREYRYRQYAYYMLHKPAGVVSATRDLKEKTVLDLLPDLPARDLVPAGRLDKDTEGLLLITNDGALVHSLLAPGRRVEKTYLVTCTAELDETAVKILEDGVEIGDSTPTSPARLVRKDGTTWLLTITEGRYHQVKRMFEAVGSRVIYLKRLRMGSLTLDESLPCGSYRELTQEEVDALKAL